MKSNIIDLKFIKDRRTELGFSTQEMAETLGFRDGSTYWNYETGKYRIKADMLPKLAIKLNCKIENFFTKQVAKIAIIIKQKIVKYE